jgi:hypothetical protein
MKFRASHLTVLPALILVMLAGCGGGGGTHTPLGPLPAMVTSLSPGSVVAGASAFTLTVKGTGFVSGDTVEFGSFALTSTFVSSTEMQAQVPATDFAAPGTPEVYVATSPPSSLNYGMAFTVQDPQLTGNNSLSASDLNIEANDMVWDPVSQQIYLSMPGSSSTANGTIAALNPVTGQLGISQTTGAGPDRLAVSSDGSYLYAGIDGSSALQRFTLPNLTPDISVSLGSYNMYEPYSVMDVEAAPGSPHTVAVIIGEINSVPPVEIGGISIFDDATARAVSVPGDPIDQGPGPIDAFAWNADGTYLYGVDTQNSPNDDLYRLSVDSSGVQIAQDDKIQGMTEAFGEPRFDPATGYVYGDTGLVINPSSGTVAGSFPLNTIQGGFSTIPAMTTDGNLNIAYFIGTTNWGPYQSCALEAYDMTHFTYLGGTWILCASGPPAKLIRWGPNGLAFLMEPSSLHLPNIILFSGAFVTSPAQ